MTQDTESETVRIKWRYFKTLEIPSPPEQGERELGTTPSHRHRHAGGMSVTCPHSLTSLWLQSGHSPPLSPVPWSRH